MSTTLPPRNVALLAAAAVCALLAAMVNAVFATSRLFSLVEGRRFLAEVGALDGPPWDRYVISAAFYAGLALVALGIAVWLTREPDDRTKVLLLAVSLGLLLLPLLGVHLTRPEGI